MNQYMTTTNNVTSLACSKALAEMGVKASCSFWWAPDAVGLTKKVRYCKEIDRRTIHHHYLNSPAYLLSELWEVLGEIEKQTGRQGTVFPTQKSWSLFHYLKICEL